MRKLQVHIAVITYCTQIYCTNFDSLSFGGTLLYTYCVFYYYTQHAYKSCSSIINCLNYIRSFFLPETYIKTNHFSLENTITIRYKYVYTMYASL